MLAALVLVMALPSEGGAQAVAEPVLAGRVQVGDTAMTSGMVVLHHFSDTDEATIDSTRIGRGGTFSFALPGVPDPALNEVYFATVTYLGVVYPGRGVSSAIQLDSIYEIQAYDTLTAPPGGAILDLEARTVIMALDGRRWQIAEFFFPTNNERRTIVPSDGGRVWSHPLPAGAVEVATTGTEVAYEDGSLVVRAPVPPGSSEFLVQYFVDSVDVSLPVAPGTDTLQLLVREPAPPLDVEGLVQGPSVSFEDGATFRQYGASGVTLPFVTITIGEESEPPPVYWIAVVLALVLAVGGLTALRSRRSADPVPADVPEASRRALLIELAKLDEAYESSGSHSRSETREYRRRRAELMSRLQRTSGS